MIYNEDRREVVVEIAFWLTREADNEALAVSTTATNKPPPARDPHSYLGPILSASSLSCICVYSS